MSRATVSRQAYINPSLQNIRMLSVTLNLWQRQWRPALSAEGVALAQRILHDSRVGDKTASVLEAARVKCRRALASLAAALGESHAYRVIGDALDTLDAEWCKSCAENNSPEDLAASCLALAVPSSTERGRRAGHTAAAGATGASRSWLHCMRALQRHMVPFPCLLAAKVHGRTSTIGGLPTTVVV